MDSLSRRPSDYRPDPDGHFEEQTSEHKRDIPPVVIRKAIEGGDAVLQDNGNVKLTTTYLGDEYAVVVDPNRRYKITAFEL